MPGLFFIDGQDGEDGFGVPGPAGANGASSTILLAELSLTAVQIRALNSSPQTLVAAPGGNKIVVPVRVQYWVTRTATAYSADPTFSIRWAGAVTELFTPVGFFLATASAGDTFRNLVALEINTGYAGVDPRNAAVQIRTAADVTTGTGTMKVSMLYYIAGF